MNTNHDPRRRDNAEIPGVPVNSDSGGNANGADERFIEIRGCEGSRAVYRMKVASHEDVTGAERLKIAGIARRFPAAAFDALLDPDTTDLMLNSDGEIWWKKLGCDSCYVCDMSVADADELIRMVAGYLKLVVTRDKPILEGIIPIEDSRFAGAIPPVAARPVFAIRKRAVNVFTLADYVDSGVMTVPQCEAIREAVLGRRNILIVGGTGSGKTTLGNAVLNEITLSEPLGRQVILEDTPELRSTAANLVNLQTTETCTMTDLVKTTLRLCPDWIVIGEVRGREAFDLIQAFNTGHAGLATLHANDCASGLRRLKSLISQHPFAPRDIEPDIALAVNVMVNIIRSGEERRIREIARVREYDPTHRENNGYRLDVL